MLKASLRSFLAHRGRLVLSALAVALSVAFVAGTLIFVDTVSAVFADVARASSADVTVAPRTEVAAKRLTRSGRIPTVPAALVDRVRGVPGVAAAHGDVVIEDVGLFDHAGEAVGVVSDPSTIALGWCACAYSPVRLASGREPHGVDEVVLDAESARKSKVRVGDRLRLVAARGPFDVTVVGIASYRVRPTGDTLVFLDDASAAARLIGRPDVVTQVSVTAESGVSDAELRARVTAALGADPGLTVRTRAESTTAATKRTGELLTVVEVGLLGFAGLSAVVGAFLIFNTFSMLVARRTRELGLMRAIGASRADVNRSVLTEAVLLGSAGSTLGLVAGYGLAAGLTALLSAFGVATGDIALVFSPLTAFVGYGVGLLATVSAAWVPARRAGRVSPMAALREAHAPPVSLRRRAILGASALVPGVGALASGNLVLVAAGGAATLVAFVLLIPVLARPLIPVLASPYCRAFGRVGRLGRDNALRDPRRTGATAGALMIGVALVAAVAVVTSSMSVSFDRNFARSFHADVVVGSEQALSAQVADAVRAVPGVGTQVRTRRSDARITVKGRSQDVELDGADGGVDAMLGHTYSRGSAARGLAPDAVVLDADYAKRVGATLGDPVVIRVPGGVARTLWVGGLRTDQPPGNGGDVNPLVGLDTFALLAPDALDDTIYVRAAAGVDPGGLRVAIKAALADRPNVAVRTRADYQQSRKQMVRVLLGLAYGLLALTIVIALLGVVNTLALSVVERTREIGVLRALGLSRRQIRRMIRLESLTIALYGATLGLALGVAWGVGARRALAADGVAVLVVPWTTIGVVIAGATLAGLAAALVPAWRAARLDIVAAVTVDQ
ncbi:ABC transporter permease [Embleya scabrispora]|uniref:ABC transporter permease n=1 Tax=Embleya scabrispora TaxID=159449 RepID=UPI000366C5BF|nr:FtsX-like permease family protein [Embleya scabrispora]MYS86452.1 FtsX-like permease family protein [Streptomyces sp. SID5474]